MARDLREAFGHGVVVVVVVAEGPGVTEEGKEGEGRDDVRNV